MKKPLDGTIYSGKCVTGFNLDTNRIIRLVQNRLGAPIENPYCNWFHPLDVFDIKIKESCPIMCQTENVLSDYRNAKHLGRYEAGILDIYQKYCNIQHDHSFMLDGSYKLEDISLFKHSLEIIKVTNLRVYKDDRGKTKCSFTYRGWNFRYVSVTDPDYRDIKEDLFSREAFLVVSIPTDDLGGNGYYKFVATVFPAD